MKILVGMSGGVDSSCTAYLLKEQHHQVSGAIMKVWGEQSSLTGSDAGPQSPMIGGDAFADATQICRLLDIPLYPIDCIEQYRELVLTPLCSDYSSGRTPNPCVICNQLVKFSLLPALASALSNTTFDYFATGHYARIRYDQTTGRHLLMRALVPEKDQTYFLYRLNQEQLSRTLFPLGGYSKAQVRALAAQAGLPVFNKQESQDLCIGNYTQLVSHNCEPGDIIDTSGRRLGEHQGISRYTIGQRKGLGIATGKPAYVVRIDVKNNLVVVGAREDLASNGLVASDITCITARIPERTTAKIRSAAPDVPCSSYYENGRLTVQFDSPQYAVTPGQSVVLYDNDIVCGGGFIEKSL